MRKRCDIPHSASHFQKSLIIASWLLTFLFTGTAFAQENRTITGIVRDVTGEPLIGASVIQKGTNNGVITDVDGNFTLTVPADATLSIAYMGYATREINLAKRKKQGDLKITLSEDTQQLKEVVVTAMGIKKDTKRVGYAISTISADELVKAGAPNFASAMYGKAPGVRITQTQGGSAGAVSINVRGLTSITGNNQPLIILDGVPIRNGGTGKSTDFAEFGNDGQIRSNGLVDINPEDIESISVLKGPNAAALYGSRAGNGVILVTTKKGSHKQGFGVTYSGNFTWSQAAETIKMQKKYGQGSNGKLNYLYDDDKNPIALTGELSFGPALDGHLEPSWLGEEIPYKYYGDKLKDYFNTGFSQFHTVALGNTTEKSHFRVSVGFNGNNGLFKDETLDKLTTDLNAGTVINDYLSFDGKISLSHMKAKNRPYTGLNGEVAQLLLIPGNVRLSDLANNYTSADRLHQNWFGPDQQYSNPYYVRHRFQNSDERWRAFGYYSANLNLTDWLKFNAKYSFDYYRTRIQTSDLGLGDQAISTPDQSWQEALTNDNMQRGEENHFEQNIQFLLMGDNQLTPKLRLGYTVGANIMYLNYELLSVGVQDMLDKDNWIFNTGYRLVSADNDGHERAMYSVFGSAQLAYDEYLSLDITARNDWSSTLPAKNNSFFYPSASVSYVFSDFMRSINKPLPSWITFAKLRLSAAQVGKDPSPYSLYNTRKFTYDMGIRQPVVNTIMMNRDLKPEIKTSYEAGLDMKFLGNRLGFDFTYYYNSTKNQAMLVDASAPWTQQWVNAGKITNSGVEFMLYGTPVKTKDMTFDLTMNIAHNRSTVKELADGVNRVYFNGDPNMPVKVGAVAGGKLGDIYANNLMKRDDKGNIIVGSNGLPQPENGDGNLEQYLLDHPIGNIQPDLLMSITPSFTYKGFNITAMFDMKFGGDIVSVSEGMATAVGTSERTAYRGEYKEINGVWDYYLVVPGVKEDGTPNDIPVSAQSYYSTIGLYKSQKGYAEEFVHDASYIKLKELSVGYSFPQSVLKRTPLTSLRLSFVARNLCFLMKHTPGNPDGGYDTTMFSQALDYMAVPYTRTFGFSINLGF